MLPHLKTILGTKLLFLSQRYLPLFAYTHAKFERVEVFLKGQARCLKTATVLPDYRGHFLISLVVLLLDTPNLIHTLLSYLYAGSSWQHKKNPSTRHSRTPSPLNLIQNAILFVMSPFQFIDC